MGKVSSLKDWLIAKMEEEYRPDLSLSANVTSLVEEVRSLRKLAQLNETYVNHLIDWLNDDRKRAYNSRFEYRGQADESGELLNAGT